MSTFEYINKYYDVDDMDKEEVILLCIRSISSISYKRRNIKEW